MFEKIKQRNLLIAGGIASVLIIVFLASTIVAQHPFEYGEVTSTTEATSTLPARLKIPAINVDAAIEQVGLLPDGTMDVPKGPADVAWYELGSHPGEIGSAVIAGHEGWKNNTRAVFDNLHTLQVGEKIYVEDADGTTITFIVREIRIYDPHQDASNVFSSNDGRAHLNLITCEGVWNAVSKTYANRLIVFADKE